MDTSDKRLYVGNLFNDVTEDDLKSRFNRFGPVSKVEIKQKTDMDGHVMQTFAFVDISLSGPDLTKCINTLANSKWKGKSLKIEAAKESFMTRIARERQGNPNQGSQSTSSANYDPLNIVKGRVEKMTSPTKKNTSSEDTPASDSASGDSGGEKKFRHLGAGDRDREGDFGRKSRLSDTGGSEGYNPLKMLNRHLQGADPLQDEEEGEPKEPDGVIEDGFVTFNDEADAKSVKRGKVYHSDSEEENKSSKKKDDLSHSSKQKEKEKKVKAKKSKAELTARFLEKSKQKDETGQASKNTQPTQAQKPGKRYYSSSEDEASDDEEAASSPVKAGNKRPQEAAGRDIMTKFKSFASSVWADSDEEDSGKISARDRKSADGKQSKNASPHARKSAKPVQEEAKYAGDEAEEEEPMEEDEDNTEVDLAEERQRSLAVLSSVVGHDVGLGHAARGAQGRSGKADIVADNYMPRFDPTAAAEDDQQMSEDADSSESEMDDDDNDDSAETSSKSRDKSKDKKDPSASHVNTELLRSAFTSLSQQNTAAKSNGLSGQAAGAPKTPFSFGFSQPAQSEQDDRAGSDRHKQPTTRSSRFRLDSSDDEADRTTLASQGGSENDQAMKFGQELLGKGRTRGEHQETFFLCDGDARLSEGIQFFFTDNTVDPDKLREEYKSKRPQLAAILKKKVRSRNRQQQDVKTKKGPHNGGQFNGGHHANNRKRGFASGRRRPPPFKARRK